MLGVPRMAPLIHSVAIQPSLWHSGFAEDIKDLWEPWMRLVDRLLVILPASIPVRNAKYQSPFSHSKREVLFPASISRGPRTLHRFFGPAYHVLQSGAS